MNCIEFMQRSNQSVTLKKGFDLILILSIYPKKKIN